MTTVFKTYDDVRVKVKSNRELFDTEKHLLSPPVREAVDSTFDICLFLVDKLEELDNKISKNSSNSSLPPSSDPNKRGGRNKGKTGKKTGGQPGHKGHNLKMVENPSVVITHAPKGKCDCGKNLSELKLIPSAARQVFEIEIVNKVIEHQSLSGICSCGVEHCGEFPEGVTGSTQYGASVRGIVSYLSAYQIIPSERLAELMGDLFNYPLSEGTVDNIKNEGKERLSEFESKIKDTIQEQKLGNVDETPIRVGGHSGYLHVFCNKALSFISYHATRGMKAVVDIGVLDKFKGILLHDCFSMYFNYGKKHAVCNGHLLRELDFVIEKYSFTWAKQVKTFLIDANELVKMSKAEDEVLFDHADCERFEDEFNLILLRGRSEMKHLVLMVKNQGKRRGKQHPALNLCNRMLKLQKEILLFLQDFDVPFTNNEAERDLRMSKVQMKVSGCFRSEDGARCFALFRSYIQTMKKHGLNIFEGITNLFNPKGNATLGIIFKAQS
jgi:transposase